MEKQTTEPKEIGKRIKEKRMELKLSMRELGNRIGVNKSTIQRYEAFGVDPGRQYIINSLADALDTNVSWLMGYSGNKNGSMETKLGMSLGENITSFVETLTTLEISDNDQMMVSGMMTCIIDQMKVLATDYAAGIRKIEEIRKNEMLHAELAKLTVDTSVIAEHVYRDQIKDSVDGLKKMADCILNLHDRDKEWRDTFTEIYHIRNAALKRISIDIVKD